MKLKSKLLATILLTLLISSCSNEYEKPTTIAINPWPGYEFLYLAEQKGYFKQVGANIKLIQLGSLSDAQRAYINGFADGFASTIIEAVQAEPLGGKPLNIVLIPDYSDGGDVIITTSDISNITSLKGKTIGCEVASLGIFLLQRALSKAGLTLEDINVINIEQADGEQAMLSKRIDAFVTYPPVSVNILKHTRFKTAFTSAEIPREIIDTVSISTEVLNSKPLLVQKLHQAWQLALDYAQSNPEDAYNIMAKREGISSEEFKDVLSDLKVQNTNAQKKLFSQPDDLQHAAKIVCDTLVHVKSIETDCTNLPNLIYRGSL